MAETFGRYTVVGQLGRGAMGVVYLANDPTLNRQVAVKTVDLNVDDPEQREFLRNQLLRDARAAAVLKHPNIVAIYDVFEDGARAYVVMEYVEGDSLASRLKNSPLPDASGILKVMRQASDALDYTHARGVIHRDIKPGNIMIDSTGTTKIMDFGIARITDSRTCTPTGMVMGTVEYMAPEQILGETLDGRADQFALAVVAYQMMTGSTLFGPNSVATLTYKVVNEVPPPPSTRNSLLPRGVDLVLAKALSKKAAERFATCTEFAGALALAFAESPTGPLPAPTAARPRVVAPAPAPVAVAAAETTVAMPASAPVAETPASRTPLVIAAVAVLVLGSALAAVVLKPWTHFHRAASVGATVSEPGTTPPATAPPEEKAAIPAPAPAKSEPSKPAAPKPDPVKSEVAAAVPAKSAKPEPPAPEPAKAPAATPAPVVAPPAKPVETPEPAVEVEMAPAPPAPKGGGAPTPFTQAMQRGQQLVKANDYQAAIQSYSQAISLRADAPLAYYNRGAARQHLQQFQMAIEDYMQTERLDPKMAMAYIGVGTSLVHLHRDPEALAHFERAIQVKPELAAGYLGRGGIYFRRKQYGPALADYDQVIKLNPRSVPAYEGRAHVREEIGDKVGAAADRRMAASLQKQ